MILKNKVDSYAIYQQGGFGNKLRTWSDYEEFAQTDFNGLVCLRYKEPASHYCRYNVPAAEVPDMIANLVKQGADYRKLVISEMAPDDDLLFQGEVMRSPNYYNFFYSREPLPMREALKRGVQIQGLAVVQMFREGMSPSSFEDFQALMDLYPDSVVELSVYSKDIGFIPGRNTIVWEVRNY